MKKLAILCALFLYASCVPAQTATPAPAPAPVVAPTTTFSITSQAVALPGGEQTVAATIVGGTYAVTTNLSIRNDNLMAPGNGLQAYFGGLQYYLNAAKLLAKTTFANAIQPYITASMGVDIVSPANAPTQQHYSFLAGGGLNYDPSNTGHFSVNLIEVRWAKLPGYANSTAVVASGVKLSF